ncbi:MAG: hypothetical protein HYV09_30320 [Deltaproteobacteria bacterium]|nr:hypothetical protein [Deltaproteobacteria bacterium]
MRNAARGSFAALALVAIVLLVRHAGSDAFVASLRRALPWMPLLLALEGVRIGADLISLRSLCGADARRWPLRAWIGLHLEANAALVVLPGGRAVSEGMKVARLSPLVGRGRATALVATQHAATMLTIALACALGALAARRVAPVLALAMAIHAGVTLAGAAALRVSLARAKVPRFLAGATLDELRAAARALPFLPRAAFAAKLVNRAAQLAQLAILLHVVGAATGALTACIATGVTLLGGLLGELSLAQIGCTDAAFVAATSALSLGVGGALAIASLARFVQLTWSAVGSALSLSSRLRVRRRVEGSHV